MLTLLVHTLFRFPQLSPNVPFLFQDSVQETTLRVLSRLLKRLRTLTVSQTLPAWVALTVWRGIGQAPCRMPLYWSLSRVVLVMRPGSQVFRRKTAGTQSATSRHHIDTAPHGLSLLLTLSKHLAEELFLRFLRSGVILLPPPSRTALSGRE